ncbi:MAG: hypothetical protein K8R35_08815 [Bacteroidales bacterium]|nr:hypothetical protein [Bacteroidales bacterium]
MKTFFVFIILVFVSGYSYGQEEGDVKYTHDFRFNDGIFVSFDQVRQNAPIPKARIVTSADFNARDFFVQVFENDQINYYDAMGIRQELDIGNIWGYSRNGILYIQIQGNFNRITFVGKLAHFVADITTYDRRYYGSPYSNYNSYYSPYSYNSYYSPYYYPYSPSTVSRSELVQYIIDFETGDKLKYDVKNVELALMKDPELHLEFVSLPRKKKKQMMFLYLRKYNERNPLYIPKK